MLTYFFYALFILACLVMIISVLLQPGKADAGALFTSSVSSTAFGPRGTQTILAKITIIAAALFMLVALMLSLPTFTGSRSVLQSTTAEATPTPTPAATPQQNAAPQASPAAAQPAANTNNAAAPAANSNAKATASPAAKK